MEIVVSGMSGKFPESENIQEFWENLKNGVDMVTENCRWPAGLYNLPSRGGTLQHLDKFDAQFFGVHAKQADFMDPQLRILLELTYEAILDAGVNPETLRGSRTGVFIGAIISESEEKLNEEAGKINGYALLGCSLSMFPNRISFCFDLKGPSFSTDTACSASLQALHQAVTCMRTGQCEAAIVGTSNICLNPRRALNFHRLQMLSPDGKCKAFDASGSGYVRSEAAVVIFLQKRQDALRSYAEILHVKTNQDGFTPQGITYPGREAQKMLLEETYSEAGIKVDQVCYVECHGTGTKVGDPEELSAISEVLRPKTQWNEKNPLLIGSVKSNMGHSEPAAGLCGLVKILLALQHDLIPANWHFSTPHPEIPSLWDGRLQVVTKNREWPKNPNSNFQNGDIIVGLNSFGFGGSNVHAIVKGERRSFSPRPLSPDIILVPISGRTKKAVEKVLKTRSLAQDEERIALLQKLGRKNLTGLNFRGFGIYRKNGQLAEYQVEKQDIDVGLLGQSEVKKRPLWLIFSGMGGQWAGMGRELMIFPVFRQSIEKSSQVLKRSKDQIDLHSVLGLGSDCTESKPNNQVLNTFVSVVAIQVALVDLLTSLNLEADGLIGHSFGELACAYADGCLSHDQVILSAWARGRAILDCDPAIPAGGMAAVGLTWDEATAKCPPSVYSACHNAKDSVTISGAVWPLSEFLEDLKGQKIFTKQVNSCGLPFHSPLMEGARKGFEKLMSEIIPEPKPITKRWISTSTALTPGQVEFKVSKKTSVQCSAQYFVNNLLSPVRFHEALENIPKDAIVIEVAPHAILLPILKRALQSCNICLGLQCKSSRDNVYHFLKTMGTLFTAGLNPCFTNIYGPKIFFPVSGRAKSISPLVSTMWYHDETWTVPNFSNPVEKITESLNINRKCVVTVSLDSKENQFYFGHKIDGRFIFPGPGYLVLLWSYFSGMCGDKIPGVTNLVPVAFENVVYHRATILQSDQKIIEFQVDIQKGTGNFEILECGQTVVTGVIRRLKEHELESDQEDDLGQRFEQVTLPDPTTFDPYDIPLNKVDIYKVIGIRGYGYSGEFKGITRADNRGRWGHLEWRGNWVTFLDNFFQLLLLTQKTTNLTLLSHFEKLTIDPDRLHQHAQNQTSEPKTISVVNDLQFDLAHCKGVQLQGVVTTPLAPKEKKTLADANQLVQHFQTFAPHFDVKSDLGHHLDSSTIFKAALTCCIQIVLENSPKNELDILLVTSASSLADPEQTQFLRKIQKVVHVEKSRGFRISVQMQKEPENVKKVNGQNLVVVDCEKHLTPKVMGQVNPGGFFLLYNANFSTGFNKNLEFSQLTPVAQKIAGGLGEKLLLFQKLNSGPEVNSWDDLELIDLNHVIDTFVKERPASDPGVEEEEIVDRIREKIIEIGEQGAVSKDSRNRQICAIYCDPGQPNLNSVGPEVLENLIFDMRKGHPWGPKLRILQILEVDRQDLPRPNDLGSFLSRSFSEHDMTFFFKTNLVFNVYKAKSGEWGSYRYLPVVPKNWDNIKGPLTKSTQAYFTQVNEGASSCFAWVESPLTVVPENTGQTLCRVHYAPLDFRNMRPFLGHGQEFSGRDLLTGQRIMGCVDGSKPCVATSVLTNVHLTWPVPIDWSLSQASTVPFAHSLAYYALLVRGGMKEGDTLLINLVDQVFCDSPALFVAIVNVALAVKRTRVLIVTSIDKTHYGLQKVLQKSCPELEDENFINVPSSAPDQARSRIILSQVYRKCPNGINVAVVSSSSPFCPNWGHGPDLDLILTSVQCLSSEGKLLSLEKIPMATPSKCSRLLRTIVTKKIVVQDDLRSALFEDGTENEKNRSRVATLFSAGLNSGVVRPLDASLIQIVPWSKTGDQFSRSDVKNNEGPLLNVLKIRGEETEELENSPDQTVIFRTYFDPRGQYLIFCWGDILGGAGTQFTLQFVDWMISKGARNIVLLPVVTGSSEQDTTVGKLTGFQSFCLRKWGEAGVQVSLQVFENSPLTDFFKNISHHAKSARGIFLNINLTHVTCERDPTENFVALRKFARNLDRSTRHLKNLDHFVILSRNDDGKVDSFQKNCSFSTFTGICENRVKFYGVPGLAANFGPVVEIDIFKKLPADSGQWNDTAIMAQDPGSVFSLLEKVMTVNKVAIAGEKPDRFPDGGIKDSFLTNFSNFLLQPPKDDDEEESDLTSKDGAKFHNDFCNLDERAKKVLENVFRILGFHLSSTQFGSILGATFAALGVDSLMTMELDQYLHMTVGLKFSDQEIRQMTIRDLLNMRMGKNANFDDEVSKSSLGRPQVPPDLDTLTNPDKTVRENEEKMGYPEEKPTNKNERVGLKPGPQLGCDENHFCSKTVKNLLKFSILASILLILLSLSKLTHFGMIVLFKIFKRRPIQGVHGNQGYLLTLMGDPPGFNSVQAVKISGPFHPGKVQDLKTRFLTRVLHWHTNILYSEKSGPQTVPYYAPFDLLFWRWRTNFLFDYWERQTDFELDKHFKVDECPSSVTLDQAIERTAGKWLGHSWAGDDPQWAVQILAQEGAPDWAILFVFHRGYGDFGSLQQLIEQVLWNPHPHRNSTSPRIEDQSLGTLGPEKLVDSLTQKMSTFWANSRLSLLFALQMTRNLDFAEFVDLHWSQLYTTKKQNVMTIPMPRKSVTSPKISCRTLKMDLSQFLRGKTRNSFNAVMIATIGWTFRRIWKRSTGEKLSETLFVFLPCEVPGVTRKMGVEDHSTSWMAIPFPVVEEDDDDSEGKDDAGADFGRTVEIVERILKEEKDVRKLYARLLYRALWTRMVKPLTRRFSPDPELSVCLSTLPWFLADQDEQEREKTTVNSKQDPPGSLGVVKEVASYPPFAPSETGVVVPVIQGSTVALTWTTSAVLEGKIPEFVNEFFPTFQAELARLT